MSVDVHFFGLKSSSLYSKDVCVAAIMLRETFFPRTRTQAYEHDLEAYIHEREKHTRHGMHWFFSKIEMCRGTLNPNKKMKPELK